ncbi:inositol monophosphatase family protein [Pseudomonas sp. PDM05]|uniref:inositol monophosphatase family protein n=1 Tax=Pseudomonas sp. PDM05 TaxID=2769301 RepID=UPI003999D648
MRLLRRRNWARPRITFCWVVDPNDSTSDFLIGLKRSAISVGLLRDNHPVLSVVHAPVKPSGVFTLDYLVLV